ncbi:MAG: O-antigen ligase family protein [bacterium]|nr:O-antigen ligase family protein [bacterium]
MPRRDWVTPDNGWLIAGATLAVALLTAASLLLLGSAVHILLVAGGLVGTGVMLFSPRRALAVLVVVTAVLPVTLTDAARLPMGLKPAELVLLSALLFGAIDLVFFDRLRLRRSRVDGLVLAFLGIAVIGAIVGALHGYEAILRNARYPFYYICFFLVLQAVRRRDVTRLFAPIFVAIGVIVSIQYVLEFLGAIDLSTGENFVRIGHRQGIVLPVSLLLIANWIVHDPRRWGRGVMLALFLCTGLGFALTLGRGMWAAFGLGLIVSVWLWHKGKPVEQRRPWKGIALAFGLVLSVSATVLVFQRITGASISAHALERSRTFLDYSRDIQVLSRLMNYATALGEIAEHPILGAGQGATVTSYSFNPQTNRFDTWTAWTLDSLYLTLWLKLGLAGLLVFPWLCIAVTRAGIRVFHRSRDPSERAFAAAAVACLVGMLLLGMSDGSMVNGRFAAVFAVLLGLVMVLDADDTTSQEEE